MISFLMITTGIYFVLVTGVFLFTDVMMTGAYLHTREPYVLFPLILYLLATIATGSTAIGIFLKKNWARMSTNVLSGLAVFMGVSMGVGVLFIKPPQANEPHVLPFLIPIIGIFFIFIPGMFLWLANSKCGKEWFGAGVAAAPAESSGSRRPLVVTLLSLYYALSIFSVFFFMNSTGRATMANYPFGNIILPPLAGAILVLIISALSMLLAFGLFKMKPWAWPLLIGINAYQFLSMGLTSLLLSSENAKRIVDSFANVLPANTPYAMTAADLKGMYVKSLIFPVLLLALAVWKKNLFYPKVEQQG